MHVGEYQTKINYFSKYIDLDLIAIAYGSNIYSYTMTVSGIPITAAISGCK